MGSGGDSIIETLTDTLLGAFIMKLSDPSLLKTDAYINGKWVDAGGKTIAVTNPATGEVIANVADHGAEMTRTAIEAANAAQKKWAALTAKERAVIMRRWFNLIMENQEDLAQILTAEMGKPLAEARGEVAYGASFIDWFAEEGRRVTGDVLMPHQPDKRLVVIKQPIGVYGAITPWNFPAAMITRKAAPAWRQAARVLLSLPSKPRYRPWHWRNWLTVRGFLRVCLMCLMAAKHQISGLRFALTPLFAK